MGMNKSEELQIDEIQRMLDDSFAVFKLENPKVAEAMRVLNISYVDYLRSLLSMRPDTFTTSGNALTYNASSCVYSDGLRSWTYPNGLIQTP